MSNNLTLLEESIALAVQALGCDLWGCVVVPQKKGVLLRVYIDKQGGVNIDDCARASHQINGVLAVTNNNPLTRDYTLEVSSPGLDRTLFKFSQYENYTGQKIKLRLARPIQGRRNFQGTLSAVDHNEKKIVLEAEDDAVKAEFSFKFDEIEHAHLMSNKNDVKQPNTKGARNDE
jgi:ribosome maturation factor RimP